MNYKEDVGILCIIDDFELLWDLNTSIIIIIIIILHILTTLEIYELIIFNHLRIVSQMTINGR